MKAATIRRLKLWQKTQHPKHKVLTDEQAKSIGKSAAKNQIGIHEQYCKMKRVKYTPQTA